MGGFDPLVSAEEEPPLKYHPFFLVILTPDFESSRRTLLGGQFNWGGCLLKSNGGFQRYPQPEYKSGVECKGRRVLNCESDRTSRHESGT